MSVDFRSNQHMSKKTMYFNRAKKNLFHREEVSELTSSHLSAAAARFSTVLNGLSRLPGFIGLFPPPALDKKTIIVFNLDSLFNFILDYPKK